MSMEIKGNGMGVGGMRVGVAVGVLGVDVGSGVGGAGVDVGVEGVYWPNVTGTVASAMIEPSAGDCANA